MANRSYQLRITLKDIEPPIWRRLAVPGGVTLCQLHKIIQIAMGWFDSRLHRFLLKDKRLKKSQSEIIRLV